MVTGQNIEQQHYEINVSDLVAGLKPNKRLMPLSNLTSEKREQQGLGFGFI
jgi:hypothetical protein